MENQYYPATAKYVDPNDVHLVVYGNEEVEAVKLSEENWRPLNAHCSMIARTSTFYLNLDRNKQAALSDMMKPLVNKGVLCHVAQAFDQAPLVNAYQQEKIISVQHWCSFTVGCARDVEQYR